MLWLGGVEVSSDPNVPSELDAGHEVPHEDVPLLHQVHVEEVREGLAVEHGHDVRVDVEEERERGGHVRTEHGALVLLDPLPKERLGALEPEVVEPVGNGPNHWPTVAPGDCAERQRHRRRR